MIAYAALGAGHRRDEVHGEPVAAEAATSRDAADTGAARVRVRHEVLPAMLSIDAALGPRALLFQEPELRPGGPPTCTSVLRSGT